MKRDNLLVIKLGGASLENEDVIQSLARDIKKLHELGYTMLLIHGGGPAINAALTERNIIWEFVDGQRKTTPEMMKVIEATLFGIVNRRLQSHFAALNIPILGISGSDMGILRCHPLNDDLGLVGQVTQVNKDLLSSLLQLPIIPLVTPVGSDEKGNKFNINADMAAMSLATALKAKNLIYMTDQKGIWDQAKETIKEIDSLGLYQLMETKVVQGGMLVKVKSVLQALRDGVDEVDIIDARSENSLFDLVHSRKSLGTRCYRN
ncbi:MAG: acetylglutamate kinase [Bdellovibrionaceae bacterium]|nr:acetylglutamate kinase [Pseudobdellovibrionaceae bacterium]